MADPQSLYLVTNKSRLFGAGGRAIKTQSLAFGAGMCWVRRSREEMTLPSWKGLSKKSQHLGAWGRAGEPQAWELKPEKERSPKGFLKEHIQP